jgi:hypothetical protein
MKKRELTFLILFTIMLFIIVSAYYMGSVKEKLFPSRLEIIPGIEKNVTTTVTTTFLLETTIPVECDTDEDCLNQTKCEGRRFYYKIGTCGSDQKCYYGDWIMGNCSLSVQNCGAECVRDSDCEELFPGTICNLESCMCV